MLKPVAASWASLSAEKIVLKLSETEKLALYK